MTCAFEASRIVKITNLEVLKTLVKTRPNHDVIRIKRVRQSGIIRISFNPAVELSYLDESQQRDFLEAMADTQNAPSLSQAQRLKKLAQEGHFSYDVAFAVMGEPKKDELDKVVIKNDTLRKYFPESSTPREMEEKIIGLLEESKTEKVVFRSDSIKKYFPSNYSSEQIENSILKMLDQRMKKRKHEAER